MMIIMMVIMMMMIMMPIWDNIIGVFYVTRMIFLNNNNMVTFKMTVH